MADIEMHRIHNLGLPAAREAAERVARDLGRKFHLKGEWSGNVLHFERPGVHGRLAIDARALDLTVTLGLLLKAMRGSIEEAITRELEEVFAKVPAPAKRRAPPGKPASPRSKKAPASRKKGG